MGKGTTLFFQVQARLPWAAFMRAVQAWDADYKVHRATCRSHCLVLLAALLLKRQSLRDIEQGLRGRQGVLRTLGVGSLDHNTLSHANRHRPAVVAEAFFEALLQQAEAVAPRQTLALGGKRFALDATEIHVSRTLFEWARCASGDAGVKLHLFLDYDGLLPCAVELATLRDSELQLARQRRYPSGTILCFDQGYFDTAWFRTLTDRDVTFVTRLPPRPLYNVIAERPVADASPVVADEIIRFTSPICRKQYGGCLRLITYYDAVGDRLLLFLTNQMTWAAETLSRIYKDRWQIELFFKWLKQNLKLRHFYGRNENAVRWQVLLSLCLYLLLARLKFESAATLSLRDLHNRLGLYLFDTILIPNVLDGKNPSPT
jgi:putative transposase